MILQKSSNLPMSFLLACQYIRHGSLASHVR